MNCENMGLSSLLPLTGWMLLLVVASVKVSDANPHAKRLYDDLLSNYNR